MVSGTATFCATPQPYAGFVADGVTGPPRASAAAVQEKTRPRTQILLWALNGNVARRTLPAQRRSAKTAATQPCVYPASYLPAATRTGCGELLAPRYADGSPSPLPDTVPSTHPGTHLTCATLWFRLSNYRATPCASYRLAPHHGTAQQRLCLLPACVQSSRCSLKHASPARQSRFSTAAAAYLFLSPPLVPHAGAAFPSPFCRLHLARPWHSARRIPAALWGGEPAVDALYPHCWRAVADSFMALRILIPHQPSLVAAGRASSWASDVSYRGCRTTSRTVLPQLASSDG